MFWWTTLLYTVPISEKELMAQCDIVLVYLRDGVFGELDTIKGPASMPKTSMTSSPKPSVPLVSSTLHTQDVHGEDRMTDTNSYNLPRHPGITQSTPVTMVTTGDTNVTPDSSSALHATEHKGLNLQPASADSTPKLSAVIPGSEDRSQPARTDYGRDEPTPPPLPSIGVFLSKTCTILLVRCDLDNYS